jgi:hypothetical protein
VNPRTITMDKNPAYPCAVMELKQEGELWRFSRLRQCRFLNNMVEQDHRRVKRLVRPGLGFGSFRTMRRTLAGYEVMEEGASSEDRRGRYEGPGQVHRRPVPGRCLILRPLRSLAAAHSPCNITGRVVAARGSKRTSSTSTGAKPLIRFTSPFHFTISAAC